MFPIISLIDKTSLQFSNTLRLCPLPSPDVQHVKKYVHRDVFRAFFNRCRAIACNWHQLAFQVVLLLCQVVYCYVVWLLNAIGVFLGVLIGSFRISFLIGGVGVVPTEILSVTDRL